MPIKEFLSLLASVLTVLGFIPYIKSIVEGKTKPHVFSWIIWGITTIIAFLAQLSGGAGLGAWPIGLSGVITLGIAVLAYLNRGSINITLSDWVFFLGSLSALPFWYFTSNPLWAIVILTTVDTVAIIPTLRKCYESPFEENMTMYILVGIRNIIAIGALEYYSLTTILFPATMTISIILMLVLVYIWQKRSQKQGRI